MSYRAPMLWSFRALADSLKPERPAAPPVLVCIDGPGGSGKSTLAKGLAEVSGDIQVIHLDDFYRPSAARYAGPIAERPTGADFDLGRFRAEALEPLGSGLPAAYHIYDWTTDRVSAHTVPVTRPLVVVEGVYSFCLALAPFYDFSIWVECPRDVRLARGIARDGEGARARWEQDWMLGEDAYVQSESPRDRAALVCDGSPADGGRVIILRGHSARWIK